MVDGHGHDPAQDTMPTSGQTHAHGPEHDHDHTHTDVHPPPPPPSPAVSTLDSTLHEAVSTAPSEVDPSSASTITLKAPSHTDESHEKQPPVSGHVHHDTDTQHSPLSSPHSLYDLSDDDDDASSLPSIASSFFFSSAAASPGPAHGHGHPAPGASGSIGRSTSLGLEEPPELRLGPALRQRTEDANDGLGLVIPSLSFPPQTGSQFQDVDSSWPRERLRRRRSHPQPKAQVQAQDQTRNRNEDLLQEKPSLTIPIPAPDTPSSLSSVPPSTRSPSPHPHSPLSPSLQVGTLRPPRGKRRKSWEQQIYAQELAQSRRRRRPLNYSEESDEEKDNQSFRYRYPSKAGNSANSDVYNYRRSPLVDPHPAGPALPIPSADSQSPSTSETMLVDPLHLPSVLWMSVGLLGPLIERVGRTVCLSMGISVGLPRMGSPALVQKLKDSRRGSELAGDDEEEEEDDDDDDDEEKRGLGLSMTPSDVSFEVQRVPSNPRRAQSRIWMEESREERREQRKRWFRYGFRIGVGIGLGVGFVSGWIVASTLQLQI